MEKKKRPAKRVEQMSRDEARRTQSRKRNKRRKYFRALLWAALVLCFACTAVVLSLTVFFNINTIEAGGSDIYGQQEITDAGGVKTGENLFLTGTNDVARKICSVLPYAGTVTVKRKLPGTLVIQVQDTAPCAAFDGPEGYILINENGKVLSTSSLMYGDSCAYIRGAQVVSAELCGTIVLAACSAASERVKGGAGRQNNADRCCKLRLGHNDV